MANPVETPLQSRKAAIRKPLCRLKMEVAPQAKERGDLVMGWSEALTHEFALEGREKVMTSGWRQYPSEQFGKRGNGSSEALYY